MNNYIDEQIISNALQSDEIAEVITCNDCKDLNDFFKPQYITDKLNSSTNVISVSTKKTYNIPLSLMPQFFILAEKCRINDRYLHYAERQQTIDIKSSGIMIDFDIYQPQDTCQFTSEVLDILIKYIANSLNETLNFKAHNTNKIQYHIFIIKRREITQVDNINNNPVYKDGFHILIPEIQVSKEYKKYFVNKLIETNVIDKVFSRIGIKPTFIKNSIIDNMCATNPVHFFGHSKTGKKSYLLHKVTKIIQYVDDFDKENININELISKEYNLTYELSLGFSFSSIDGKDTWLRKLHYTPNDNILNQINKKAEAVNDNLDNDEYLSISSVKPRIKYVKQLLDLLDNKYFDEYEHWFKVLCCISSFGITNEWKNLAKSFSMKSKSKWDENSFNNIWQGITTLKRNDITIGSLKMWAKECSPIKYAELNKLDYGLVIRYMAYSNSGILDHAHVARILSMIIGDIFVVSVNCISTKPEYTWYEFVLPETNRKTGEIYKWRKEVVPENIYKYISDVLTVFYKQVETDIAARLSKAKNSDEQKKWDQILKNFIRSERSLQNNTFQEGVIKQCRLRFHNRGFFDALDKDADIIGVGNGVLKLGVVPELISRYHEYKISKYTETIYVPYYEENPYVKELLDAFRDIFIEPDTFEYMMCLAATGLDGREASCVLTIIVGGGQNGKTFFVKMVHNTLGNMYSASGKPSLLTSAFENAGSANSAQMQQKDKRWFYIDEFNKCETLNIARVKSMVTPSWQSGRDNYQYQCNYKNICNTVVLSNYDFIIDCSDHGTWRRIYYYTGKSKFCTNPDPSNKYEKKENSKFIDEYTNSPVYQQAMLSIMCHYYSILLNKYDGKITNIPVPTIKKETAMFRNRQDMLNKFITQMIYKSPGSTEEIHINEIANKYIDWYSTNVNRTAKLVPIDIHTQILNSCLKDYFIPMRNGENKFKGIRLKSHVSEAPNMLESVIE